jgi:hypothetical protein
LARVNLPNDDPGITEARAPEKVSDFVMPEKILDYVLKKCDSTKKDLEKNWLYQITCVAASLAMIMGLGKLVSKKIFEEPGYENVLYLVLPLVSLYLFMQFGSLLSAFAKARVAAEDLVKEYFRERNVERLQPTIRPSIIFSTTSFFEYFRAGPENIGVFVHSLFAPTLLAVSHTASVYLLFKLFGYSWQGYIIVIVYCCIIVSLYAGYYRVCVGVCRILINGPTSIQLCLL